MSEPRRFLEDSGGFERSLLQSARGDAPLPGARKRTLAALGLGVGVLGAGATATAASAAASAPVVKAAASLGLLKWIGVGIAGGVLVVGAAEVAHSVSPQPAKVALAVSDERVRASIPASPSPAKKGAPAAAETTDDAIVPALEAQSAVAAPGKLEPDAPRARPLSPSPASSALADEIAALDGAREALSSGDAGRALRALDARDRAFPRGALGPEARVLRIEALVLHGDRATATRLGEAFLAASPRSPHASRIRTLLGIPAPAATPDLEP